MALKDAASIPGDVATGKQQLDASLIPRLANASLMSSPLPPEAQGLGFGSRAAQPSTDQLLSTGANGFNAWRNSDLRYDPYQFANWAQQQKQGLVNEGINTLPSGAPDLHSILEGMSNVPSGALDLTPADLDRWRKELGNTAKGSVVANPTQAAAAGRAKTAFSDFLSAALPTSVVDGSLTPAMQGAVQDYRDSVANYAAGKRSQFVNNLDQNSELQAARAHSGHAGGNPIRQNVAGVLRVNPTTGLSIADRQGLNDPEQAALWNVVQGSVPSNTVRTASNLAGGGLGHAGAIGGILAAKEGYEHGGVPGAIIGGSVPFIGTALRKLDNALASRRLNAADELIRSRSPLAAQTPPQAAFTLSPTAQQRLSRAMLAQQYPQSQDNAP